MSTKAIPTGHRTVTPYLAIKNAAKALEFYKKAFGATETFKLMMPDGRLGHAEIRLGDSIPMDLGPDWYPIARVISALPCAWLGGVRRNYTSNKMIELV